MDWKTTAQTLGIVAAPLVVVGAAVAVAHAGGVRSNPRKSGGRTREGWENEIRLWVLNDEPMYRAFQSSSYAAKDDVRGYVKAHFAKLKKEVVRKSRG